MRLKLRTRIFLNFVLIIALFGILGSVLGAVIINRTTLAEAQRRVSLDLRSAWSVLHGEEEQLRLLVNVLSTGKRVERAYEKTNPLEDRAALEAVRKQCNIDFLALTDNKGQVLVRTLEPYNTGDYVSMDPFVNDALKGEIAGGLAVLSPERLRREGGNLEERAFIVFEPTPKAKLRSRSSEAAGMVLIGAAPVYDDDHTLRGVLYAGILLNRNYALVDTIRSIVFEDKKYEGRHVGTVTIFQWDTRIATNVTLANGNRAIGTRVSADVYDTVLENGIPWYDRAFVVNDWYLSAYDPVLDVEGKVIGILYVGVLAKQYDDLKRGLWKMYVAISCAVALFVLAVGLIFSRKLTGSLTRLADGAGKISNGDLNHVVEEPDTNDEVRDLTRTFNAMAVSLRDREEKLKAVNNELETTNALLQKLNANYLDMLGFVSHELKNTLGVIFTAARALDKGMVGPLSESQQQLVSNIARNIDSAVTMTRNYLDLARIEKGELQVELKQVILKPEVLQPTLEELKQPITDMRLAVHEEVPEGLRMNGDPALLRIVFKNLLGNAVKYAQPGGSIRIGFNEKGEHFQFNIWNDGEGLSPDKLKKLFGKFVRFHADTDKTRSTGLGLFITREILAKHGGTIRAESEEGKWINFIFTLPKK